MQDLNRIKENVLRIVSETPSKDGKSKDGGFKASLQDMMKQTIKSKSRYQSCSPNNITNEELWLIMENYKKLKEQEQEKKKLEDHK